MTACDREDCNNVLIPEQVATFSSYVRLWEKIAASPQRALIFEDDVFLHPWWPEVLSRLATWIDSDELSFSPDDSKLIRLGWALCSDHGPADEVRMSKETRMANPCHAMTSAFARKALQTADRVTHTVDVVVHRQIPESDESVTIFPPIASELSWSTGEFDSLIHPKLVRADYLESIGQFEEAELKRSEAWVHARSIAHRGRR